MDFLLFVKENFFLFLISNFSLYTIFIYYQTNKSAFRTYFCCICSLVYTFHVAEFHFLGFQMFQKQDLVEGRRGTNTQTWYCCLPLWAMWLSSGLCVILGDNVSYQGMFQWHFTSVTPPQFPSWARTVSDRRCILLKEEDIYLCKYKFIFYCIILCIRRCYIVVGIWLASEHNSFLEMTLPS